MMKCELRCYKKMFCIDVALTRFTRHRRIDYIQTLSEISTTENQEELKDQAAPGTHCSKTVLTDGQIHLLDSGLTANQHSNFDSN
jgi:hypothetical protein